MQAVTTIGLDIAKSVFQIHGVDAAGNVIVRRQLKRRYVLPFFQKLPPCLVGIEACASSHHWSRELQALGHTVRLMPPAYVKPYVKRHKNDAADAEAICEAVSSRCNTRSGRGTRKMRKAIGKAVAVIHFRPRNTKPPADRKHTKLKARSDRWSFGLRAGEVPRKLHAAIKAAKPKNRRSDAG